MWSELIHMGLWINTCTEYITNTNTPIWKKTIKLYFLYIIFYYLFFHQTEEYSQQFQTLYGIHIMDRKIWFLKKINSILFHFQFISYLQVCSPLFRLRDCIRAKMELKTYWVSLRISQKSVAFLNLYIFFTLQTYV